MQLFVCDNCGCVDMVDDPTELVPGNSHCQYCKSGSWHHVFEREQYDVNKHPNVVNRSGGMGGSSISFS